ncbi:hypothetical protein NITHO_2400007 [Nitrolancea hollandica Lb]|uniref:Uncharacterized protein n=1 Tax=Nitrolancea hollandica Lb TaxID=1129897 RepID=I4EFT5_9BACT|nr:hypothetical protein NITHO_2400007 [Nitrolancea hollandica Lb]
MHASRTVDLRTSRFSSAWDLANAFHGQFGMVESNRSINEADDDFGSPNCSLHERRQSDKIHACHQSSSSRAWLGVPTCSMTNQGYG